MKIIDPEQFYTPKEIERFGIMSAGSVDTRRQMLLRHIREGRIAAKNLASESKPRYVVQGKHLLDYMDRQTKPGQYRVKRI